MPQYTEREIRHCGVYVQTSLNKVAEMAVIKELVLKSALG
jgi:hypothetical protein